MEAGRLSPPRGPSSTVGGLSDGDWQSVSDVCEPRPGPSGFSVRPHSSVMPSPSRYSLAVSLPLLRARVRMTGLVPSVPSTRNGMTRLRLCSPSFESFRARRNLQV